MAPVKFGVGQSVVRQEDDSLIRGRGRYTGDHTPGGLLHAAILRSPHAHARFEIDVSAARKMPGDVVVVTGHAVGELGGLPCLYNMSHAPLDPPYYHILPEK